jgi:hypothetical protein
MEVVAVFGELYLRSPTAKDNVLIMVENALRKFHGILGSIDCMHWQ